MPNISAARPRPASRALVSTYDVDGFIFTEKLSIAEKAWILRRQPYHQPTDSDKTVVHKNMIMLMRILTHYMPFRTHTNFSTILSQDFGGNQTTICHCISRLINGRKAFSARAGARLSPITESQTSLLLCQVVDDYLKNWTASAGTIFSESMARNLRQSWAQMMRTDPEGLLFRGPPEMNSIPAGGKTGVSHDQSSRISSPVSHPGSHTSHQGYTRGRLKSAGSSSSQESRSRSQGQSSKDTPYRERSPIRQVRSSGSTINSPILIPASRPISPRRIDTMEEIPLNPVSIPRRSAQASLSSTSRGVQPGSSSVLETPKPLIHPIVPIPNTQESIFEAPFRSSHLPPLLPDTPGPHIRQPSSAVPGVNSATGSRFSMLWEELQADMTTQVENSVAAQAGRAVAEQNATLMAGIASLRQDINTIRDNRNDDAGPGIQMLKDEYMAKLESLQAKIAEVDGARKASEELYQQQSKDHQREIRSLKQQVETLLDSNRDLTKKMEKMESVFQAMAQLYGGIGQ